jgi:hypothetical protein
MNRKLDVYLHQHLVGNLIQDEHGQMMFDIKMKADPRSNNASHWFAKLLQPR